MVEDRGDNQLSTLQGQTDNLVEKAGALVLSDADALLGRGDADLIRSSGTSSSRRGKIPRSSTSMVSTFRANVPQFFVDVNRA